MSTIEKTTVEETSKVPAADAKKPDIDENKKSVANDDSFSQALLGEEEPAAEIKEPAVETEENPEEKPVPETETEEHAVKDAVKDTVKENELPAVETEEKPAVETEKKPAVETDKKLKRQAEEGSVADDESPDKKNKIADVVVEMETDATVAA
jgi:hypothetical protein